MEATWHADVSSSTRDLHACWGVWEHFQGLLQASWVFWRCFEWSSRRCRGMLIFQANWSRLGSSWMVLWTGLDVFWSLQNVLGARSHWLSILKGCEAFLEGDFYWFWQWKRSQFNHSFGCQLKWGGNCRIAENHATNVVFLQTHARTHTHILGPNTSIERHYTNNPQATMLPARRLNDMSESRTSLVKCGTQRRNWRIFVFVGQGTSVFFEGIEGNESGGSWRLSEASWRYLGGILGVLEASFSVFKRFRRWSNGMWVKACCSEGEASSGTPPPFLSASFPRLSHSQEQKSHSDCLREEDYSSFGRFRLLGRHISTGDLTVSQDGHCLRVTVSMSMYVSYWLRHAEESADFRFFQAWLNRLC